ncbi:hypothetical protein B0T24DRAFT_413894 [Lasiosphaeria ovina]|uniref:Uncharacterized protein n=1 Tax=Lasiosphaeria ovina TaxID=92902 RepID=A0AAE0N0X3_9PEZI|nr:hypothetical protein B0T24DRAFT_413894 [Lasiosphaeria ovina]
MIWITAPNHAGQAQPEELSAVRETFGALKLASPARYPRRATKFRSRPSPASCQRIPSVETINPANGVPFLLPFSNTQPTCPPSRSRPHPISSFLRAFAQSQVDPRLFCDLFLCSPAAPAAHRIVPSRAFVGRRQKPHLTTTSCTESNQTSQTPGDCTRSHRSSNSSISGGFSRGTACFSPASTWPKVRRSAIPTPTLCNGPIQPQTALN